MTDRAVVGGTLFKTPEAYAALLQMYDRVLAQWPPHTTHNIATRVGDTFVIECGEKTAPALVLLHGASSNSLTWTADAHEYAKRFRVLAVDWPGEPGRSCPARPSFVGPGYGDWLEDVLNGLNIEKASLVGMSQGGYVALSFATTRPSRVASLSLIAPAGIVRDRLSFALRIIPLAMMGDWGMRRIGQIILGGMKFPKEVEDFNRLIRTGFRQRVTVAPPFPDEALRQLNMPVLLVGGLQDPIRDHESIARRLRSLVTHVSTTGLPRTGHVVLDGPKWVVPFLQEAGVVQAPIWV